MAAVDNGGGFRFSMAVVWSRDVTTRSCVTAPTVLHSQFKSNLVLSSLPGAACPPPAQPLNNVVWNCKIAVLHQGDTNVKDKPLVFSLSREDQLWSLDSWEEELLLREEPHCQNNKGLSIFRSSLIST